IWPGRSATPADRVKCFTDRARNKNPHPYRKERGKDGCPFLTFHFTSGSAPALAGQPRRLSLREHLHQALVQHRVSYLQETTDVCTVHQVAGRAVLLGGFEAILVD